jgi:hypothetical protein
VEATSLDIEIAVAVPEHIVWLLADAFGSGFTVTVAVIAVPVHPLAVGVMV